MTAIRFWYSVPVLLLAVLGCKTGQELVVKPSRSGTMSQAASPVLVERSLPAPVPATALSSVQVSSVAFQEPIPNPSLPSVPDGLHVADLTLDAAGLLITARTTAAQVACPACGQSSPRVHSAYWRTLTDLPWQDRAVTCRVKVRP